MEALTAGSLSMVSVVPARMPPGTLKIDVDRLGTTALHATTRLLNLLPLRTVTTQEARPEAILFRCSHLVSSPASVTPTFPAHDPNDKRLRKADRLRAGEDLVRALSKHVAVNGKLHTLEVTAAPLRLFDWQQLSAGLRGSGAQLVHLSLAGSRLGDAGLAAFGPVLLEQRSLTHLSLDGTGLTATAAEWLVRLLEASNLRQNDGRHKRALRAWARSLRVHGRPTDRRARVGAGADAARPTRSRAERRHHSTSAPPATARCTAAARLRAPAPTPSLGPSAEVDDASDEDDDAAAIPPPPRGGLEQLLVAGNALGDRGALALATHLAQNHWLQLLDARRNGIGREALGALEAAVDARASAPVERLLPTPALVCRLDGNADEFAPPSAAAVGGAAAAVRAAGRPLPSRGYQWSKAASGYSGAGATGAPSRRRPASATSASGRAALAEARRVRASLSARRHASAQRAASVERVHRGASALAGGSSAPLSGEDWAELARASGGAAQLLDAMESLIGAALQKAAA